MKSSVPEPTPDSLGTLFFDGTNYYRVVAPLPASFPLAGSRNENGGWAYLIGLYFYTLVWGFVCLLVDRRWKVVVVRRPPRGFTRWDVISIEFFDSPEGAEERGSAILADWDSEQAAVADRLSGAELGRLRRQSKDDVGGDPLA